MDKRGIIAIGLCILVLVIYQEWISRYYGTAPTPVTNPETKTSSEQQPAVVAPSQGTAPAQESAVAKAAPIPPASAKEISVETDNYIARFTNVGARLKSFKFKKYRSGVDEHTGPFEIV